MIDTADAVIGILFFVNFLICVVLLVLFFTITIKSCCDRQYSRKQRIFLYLLLASLGESIAFLLEGFWYDVVKYVHLGLLLLVNVVFCWAAVYVCFEVYAALRGTEFQCLRFRFHTVAEEVCFLIVAIIISAGFAAASLNVPIANHALSVVVINLPLIILSFIDAVGVVLVLVQLCLVWWRVEDGQVTNRLWKPAVMTLTLLVFLVFYVTGVCVWVGILASGKEGRIWFLAAESLYLLCYKEILYLFVIFFGCKFLQDFGRLCCCSQYRRHHGYEQIPGQEEVGALSIQGPVLITAGTYHTCDDMGSTTRAYQTCDESQPPQWFQPVPTPKPPVQ